MKKKSIIIFAGFTPSLINFRKQLLQEFIDKGFRVYAIAPQYDSETIKKLENLHIEFIQIKLKNTGRNPLTDIRTILSLSRLFQKIKPNILFAYTIKPVIYGSIAAKIAGVDKIYSLITGLGFSFGIHTSKQKWIGRIVQALYKLALRFNSTIFFQNQDDLSLFLQNRLISRSQQTKIINGSGVDLKYFNYRPIKKNEPFSFLLIGRIIKDKGILEFAEAAKIVKSKYPEIQFNLLGYFYDSPNQLKRSEIEKFVMKGQINYLGAADDVRSYIELCSVYVLPSYREGTPRSVLEAMAMGRPIITTDTPGCRETVIEGENGFLVEAMNPEALSEAMLKIYQNPELVTKMGKRSREIVEEKYDVHQVNKSILESMAL